MAQFALTRNRTFSSGAFLLLLAVFCTRVTGQTPAAPTPAGANPAEQQPDKRVFGVLPNYRTVEDTGDVQPLTARRKMTIACKDSFDYPIYFLSGVFAGLSQWENQNPSFGQGMVGYAKRYGGSYADLVMGNLMAEGFLPSMLHEDPRYYRRGSGGTRGRAFYALTRVFVTHTDSGSTRFNTSEVLGNAIAVGISNAYYPDNRNVHANLEKLGTQVGTDAISNVLKEFWPDIKRKLQRHPPSA